MVPTVEHVVWCRLIVAAIMRVAGVVIAFLALTSLIMLAYQWWSMSSSGWGSGTPSGFASQILIARLIAAGAQMAFGLALVAFAGRLAERFVPFVDLGKCPRCSYRLSGLPTARCPECSLELPRSYGDTTANVA